MPTNALAEMNTECMVCFEALSTFNIHHMAGCSHTICVECAIQMQSMSSNEVEYVLGTKESTLNYKVEYFKHGYTITRFHSLALQGYENPMRCPYCRQPEPMIYNFDALRFYIQYNTLEWNILERKFYQDNLASFTMSKQGATFAFKLSKDESCLHVMWTEVNAYPFIIPKQVQRHSDIKPSKKQKDARMYIHPKRYTKMIR